MHTILMSAGQQPLCLAHVYTTQLNEAFSLESGRMAAKWLAGYISVTEDQKYAVETHKAKTGSVLASCGVSFLGKRIKHINQPKTLDILPRYLGVDLANYCGLSTLGHQQPVTQEALHLELTQHAIRMWAAKLQVEPTADYFTYTVFK